MPFLSGFGGAPAIGFSIASVVTSLGGGQDQPYTGTMYYYEGADETDTTSTWATLAKWYKNSSHTQSASALPTASNATVLLNNTSADVDIWTTPASIDITGHTLTLTADNAYTLSINIIGSNTSNLVLEGPITASASINHPESVVLSGTTYYFDTDLAIGDKLYTARYSSNVASVSGSFGIVKSAKFYDVTVVGGTVTILTEIDITGPDVETFSYNLSKNSKYLGYVFRELNSSCELKNAEALIRLYTPPTLAIGSNKPVYKLAERINSTSAWVSASTNTPYAGNFVCSPSATYYKYTTDGSGYIISFEACPV